jgi:hypothetical protein
MKLRIENVMKLWIENDIVVKEERAVTSGA